MDLFKREDVIDAISNAEINFNVESDIDFSKHQKEVQEIINNVIDAQIKALDGIPHYNPVSQVDKLKAELSEILDNYGRKKEPQKIYIGTNWQIHDELLDAYRYAKANVDLAEFEKAKISGPMFIKPTKYPIRKYRVVAKGTVGLVNHYVYADDVSEDENGCYFWIEDKKVGHFTNAVAYYEVKENESDTD